MKTARQKSTLIPARAPDRPVSDGPPTPEQIRQRAHEIYVARGSAEGMALNDWLMAEQELRRTLAPRG